MKDELDHALANVAARQLGIVTSRQLRRIGVDRHAARRLIGSRRLVQVHPRVYACGVAPLSFEQRLMAASAAGGGDFGVVSHRAASYLDRLPAGAEIVEITHRRWRRSKNDTIIVHESKHLTERDVMERGPLLVTKPARTILDLGLLVAEGDLEAASLERTIEDAIRRNLVSPESILRACESHGAPIRRGVRHVEDALRRYEPATRRSESTAELELLAILRNAGFAEVVAQHRVDLERGRHLRLDTYLPKLRVAPEFDSYKYHGGRHSYMAGAERTLRLAEVGITRWPVTDDELDAGCPNLLSALHSLRASFCCE